LEFNLNLR